MSDLDKAIRDAAQHANWFGLHAALTAVLDELPDWDAGASAPLARTLRKTLARSLGVSSQDTAPAPRQARVWRDRRGEIWDEDPDTDVLYQTKSNGQRKAERPREYVDRHYGPLTEVLSPSTQTGGTP